jgi:hypothetical protein
VRENIRPRDARASWISGPACLALATMLSCRPAVEPPLVRIEATEYGYIVPRSLPEGLLHFRLVNRGQDIHEALIVRFSDSAGSAAAYVDSVRADVDFPAFAMDLGGAGLTGSGDSSEVWLTLSRGRYALVCWKGDHLRRGMAHDLEVVAAAPANVASPREDVVVTLADYAFRLSTSLTAGSHLIRVENRGQQPHEVDMFRLLPGHAVQDYIAWSEAGEIGQPPAEPIGGVGDLVPGRQLWFPIVFRPGRYFMICHVPDAQDGRPHYAHGMIYSFAIP